MKNQIHSNMPAEEYHAHPYLGSSRIARARRSWAHALAPFESTKAMDLGRGFHALVGEPQLFPVMFAKAPKCDKRTKEGKAIFEDFQSKNQGKTILTEDDYATMDGMLQSILSNKIALGCLTGGASEISAFIDDPDTGVGVKCRPDYFRNTGVIVDLKTAENASIDAFKRDMVNYGRHIQTALYLDVMSAITGQKLTNFVHIVIEKKPPYAIAIYALDDESIAQGRREYKALLKEYAHYQKIGDFPGYPEAVQTVGLPNWGIKYE